MIKKKFSKKFLNCDPVAKFEPEIDYSTTLQNYIIMHRIFRYLGIQDKKTVRLVCSSWCGEATKQIPLILHMNSTTFEHDDGTEVLECMVSRYQIKYTLALSLLETSLWNHFRFFNEYEIKDELYNQKTLDDKITSKIFSFLSPSKHLVVDLRLEVMIRNKREGLLVSQLLCGLPALKTLSLDVVDIGEEGLLHLCDVVPFSIKTFGLKFHDKMTYKVVDGAAEYVSLLDKFILKFLRLFDSISYLDTCGWTRNVDPLECGRYQIRCVSVLTKLKLENPAALNNLIGLKHATYPLSHFAMIQLFTNLKHLYLHSVLTGLNLGGATEILRTLQILSGTLESFELFWGNSNFMDESGNELEIPTLPKLRWLGVTNTNEILPEMEIPQYTLEAMDSLNFHKILKKGNSYLSNLFPALDTLKFVCLRNNDLEAFSYIFNIPKVETEVGERETFPQIKSVLISLVTDCNSFFVQTLFQMFPNLHNLKHLKEQVGETEEQKIYFVCQHDASNCSVQLVKFGTQMHIENERALMFGLENKLKLRNDEKWFSNYNPVAVEMPLHEFWNFS